MPDPTDYIAQIREALDGLEETVAATPEPESKPERPPQADRLLAIVRGEEPLPLSKVDEPQGPQAPRVAASQLAHVEVEGAEAGWALGDESGEVRLYAREILDDAGYWPGYEQPDGEWFTPSPTTGRGLVSMDGFTPEDALYEGPRRMKGSFRRGSRPYLWAVRNFFSELNHRPAWHQLEIWVREMLWYDLDPLEVHPGRAEPRTRERIQEIVGRVEADA